MHFLIECKITAIPATPQAHTLRKKILLLMIQNQEYNNIIGKTKGALFAKRKVHEKFKYIETEADIKSVSASVVQMCLLCEFKRCSNTN